MPRPDPIQARQFAVEVVRQLRAAGYESLWAGGCVRDQLMGREPKDYDVATNAIPDQIRDVFGRKRTLAIGASFGVITVLGPHGAGQIDVATFRRDSAYSDGRHPDSVTFCTAEEDAQRRDFTINGLFFDPLEDRVLDFIGGRQDLQNNFIRAIGVPAHRFAEDKLRMLRAVRFAATLGFEIEAETLRAIQDGAADIRQVSAERIAEELRRMFGHPGRTRAFELLRSTSLLPEILPRIAFVWRSDDVTDADRGEAWDRTVRILVKLAEPEFATVFAAVLREAFIAQQRDSALIHELCRDLRLSNEERDSVLFILSHEEMVRRASTVFWPTLQRVLIAPRAPELLALAESVALVLDGHTREVEFCRRKLALPRLELDPPPLLSGADLQGLGIPAGPVYKQLLEEARDAQLMGLLQSTDEARSWIRMQWLHRAP